jgi:hypothetical protein
MVFDSGKIKYDFFKWNDRNGSKIIMRGISFQFPALSQI